MVLRAHILLSQGVNVILYTHTPSVFYAVKGFLYKFHVFIYAVLLFYNTVLYSFLYEVLLYKILVFFVSSQSDFELHFRCPFYSQSIFVHIPGVFEQILGLLCYYFKSFVMQSRCLCNYERCFCTQSRCFLCRTDTIKISFLSAQLKV